MIFWCNYFLNLVTTLVRIPILDPINEVLINRLVMDGNYIGKYFHVFNLVACTLSPYDRVQPIRALKISPLAI